MALAFEYYLDSTYDFKTSFQAQLAEYLSEAYMEYINEQNLTVEESAVGFDLDGDGELNSTIALTIEYDLEAYPETNGYHGSYLDLYLAEFTENLQWYLDNLDYAEGWTWFDEDGSAVEDLTNFDKASAFIEGRYAKSSGGTMGGMTGMMGGMGDLPDGELPDDLGDLSDGRTGGRGNMGGGPGGDRGDLPDGEISGDLGDVPDGSLPGDMGGNIVGTPDAGTTQSATGSGVDSSNYASFEEMVEAYRADIEEIYTGDEYGNNIVELYNPLHYIGADGTDDPTWTKIVMGAAEGDMSMFTSLNLQIAWLNAGVDAEIEWQWDGGHVPSEVLGNSFSLYVDQMYGEYVDGAVSVAKEAASEQLGGTAEEATGTDLSGWVSLNDGEVSFTLADAAAYRTAGASKAMPGFDVIDYGQEDYVFGDSDSDARHWNKFLLEIYEKYADVPAPLFNAEN